MKFRVERDVLADAVTWVARGLPNRPPVPVDARDDWPLRRLVERAGLAQFAAGAAIQDRLRGANTPEERDRLLRESDAPHMPNS